MTAGPAASAWRPEDEALLRRLEDEEALAVVFRFHVGAEKASKAPLPARASGLMAEVRKLPGGDASIAQTLAGDPAPLAAVIERGELAGTPPAYLHHLALYSAHVARQMAKDAPESANAAWTRTLAAWFALAEEGTYLGALELALAGVDAKRAVKTPSTEANPKALVTHPDLPLFEVLREWGKMAEAASRDLAPSGHAALLALASTERAAHLGGASARLRERAVREAVRLRGTAVDAALCVIGEALDDANARGLATTEGATQLLRVTEVWEWSGHDGAVPPFLLDRLAPIAWDIYRTRNKPQLRALLEPHRRLIEAFASMVEIDPSKVAYASACAQMFVFFSDVAHGVPAKLTLAERAVRVCPSHRNGRVILAALLCDTAQGAIEQMGLVVARGEVERVETLIDRAASLHPDAGGLADARSDLEHAKKTKIVR